MAQGLLYVLTVDTRGLQATVRLNDVTVFRRVIGEPCFSTQKVNLLVGAGENEVVVLLAPLPPLPGPAAPPPSRFALSLQQGQIGVSPGDSGLLVNWEWDAVQMPLPPGPEREVLRRIVTLPRLPWRPRWMSAPGVPPEPAPLRALFTQYAASLRSRNADSLLALNGLKFEEQERAFGLGLGHVTAGYRSYLQNLFESRDFAVDAVPSYLLQYVREGRSRLVRFARPDGSAPIVVISGGKRLPVEITVSSIDGQWRIVL
jgi:hypothetical protein